MFRENSTIYIYRCDPYYDEAFTIPSLPFIILHAIYCHSCFLDKPSPIGMKNFFTITALYKSLLGIITSMMPGRWTFCNWES